MAAGKPGIFRPFLLILPGEKKKKPRLPAGIGGIEVMANAVHKLTMSGDQSKPLLGQSRRFAASTGFCSLCV